jgi:hypothetical protein
MFVMNMKFSGDYKLPKPGQMRRPGLARRENESSHLQKMKIYLPTFFFCGVAAIILAGCGARHSAQETASEDTVTAGSNVIRSKDTWQRMKDCADATDLLIKRHHLEEGSEFGLDYSVWSVENHYSPRFERCFARVDLGLKRQAAREAKRDGTLDKTVPDHYWMLYDAFEGGELTRCSSYASVESFCRIGGAFGNCSECQGFTDDRMNEPDPKDPLGIRKDTFIKPGGALEKLLEETQKRDSQKR